MLSIVLHYPFRSGRNCRRLHPLYCVCSVAIRRPHRRRPNAGALAEVYYVARKVASGEQMLIRSANHGFASRWHLPESLRPIALLQDLAQATGCSKPTVCEITNVYLGSQSVSQSGFTSVVRSNSGIRRSARQSPSSRVAVDTCGGRSSL
jgi:hypothetical protein